MKSYLIPGILLYCIFRDKGIPFLLIEDLIQLIILCFFTYYLIAKPKILPIELKEKTVANKKYAKVKLSIEQRSEYSLKLEKYMVENRAFLDMDLSIPKISQELNIPKHLLSMTINIEFNQNFFNYVNQHRIKYAGELLHQEENRERSILDIAYTSGFQSKSSFNKFFKSFYNATPREYRKHQRACSE